MQEEDVTVSLILVEVFFHHLKDGFSAYEPDA